MKKIANIKQLASGVSAMNPSTRTGHRVRTESVTRLFQALFFSVAVLSLLNACSEGNDNVTPGSIRGISGDLGEPKVTKGVLTVDQFVATVYNGKDSSNKSTGVLFPRCGGCHNPLSSSKQQPYFADSSAANAYVVATSQSSKGTALFLLSLTTAKDSAVVQKVLSGHNCWSGSSAVSCQNDANELTDRIKDWVNLKNGTGAGSGSGATSIVVKSLAETLAVQVTSESDPQPFKTFPDDIAGGNFTSLHTILKTNCNGCHISSAATPQTPYFADGSEAVSYAALKDNQKIDINVIEKSRIYLRLQNDAHNCWSTCTANAAEVLAAIKVFSDQISVPAALPNGWVTSKALTLGDGQVVSGGVRYEPNIVAKYEFKEGSGTVARDTSGIVPAIDLTLFGNVKWVSGWGVQFLPALPGKGVSRLMSGSVTESRKLLDMIIPNGEFSIEAWVVPANTAQGADAPAVMMSYGVGAASRNLTLGQQLYNYTLATRIDSANADQDIVGSGGANELLATPDADEVLQATLQHVVVTYRGSVDPNDTNAVGRKVYVNGELVFSDPTALGILDDWDEGYLLSLGADSDGSNPFLGRLRLLAIHNAALPADKIRQNFDAGVGKKYHLLFNVGKLDTRMHEQSYILMTIEEFDDFSYKIFDPRFVILGADLAGSPALAETSDVITIKGMRIGINGKEPEVGQVFGKLNEKLSWTATGGVIDIPQVSNILATVQHDFVTGASGTGSTVPKRAAGTIIPKASGADVDQFFLTFEDLGGSYARTDPSTPSTFPPILQTYQTGGADFNYALRNFDEVYATMAEITGIDPVATAAVGVDGAGSATNIAGIFGVIKTSLPVTEDAATFVAAQEVAITRLAFEFCSALVDDTTTGARTTFFGSTFLFSGTMATAFDLAGQNIIANALADNVVGTGIGNQPTKATIVDMLLTRVDDPLTGEDPTDVNSTNVIDETALFVRLNNECQTIGGADCSSNIRVKQVVKSMCMAVLGSAAMLIQ